MRSSFILITESDDNVGTGHLYESCTLASKLIECNNDVLLYVNQNIPHPLLSSIPCAYMFYGNLQNDFQAIGMKIMEYNCKAVITNLRKIDNVIVGLLNQYNNIQTICIDELGHRSLECDILINPLIDSYFHDYTENCKADKYFGPEYMIMKPDFSVLSKQNKFIENEIKTISICMGGADISGSTLKILCALKPSNVKINVIVGGGFLYHDELSKTVNTLNKNDIKVFNNISNVAEVLFPSDMAFCAGGNTLYELACLGVPTITIYEAPHEKSSADSFAKRGFGLCLGQADVVTEDDIIDALNISSDREFRKQQYENGKKIVDGMSLTRIVKLVGGA
jgi:spore coat polysaccharide biosynthesis predicted glycosyltransferase SpsG